jgi:hypothetical protein
MYSCLHLKPKKCDLRDISHRTNQLWLTFFFPVCSPRNSIWPGISQLLPTGSWHGCTRNPLWPKSLKQRKTGVDSAVEAYMASYKTSIEKVITLYFPSHSMRKERDVSLATWWEKKTVATQWTEGACKGKRGLLQTETPLGGLRESRN